MLEFDREVSLETSTEEELREALDGLEQMAGSTTLTSGAFAAVCMTRMWLRAEIEKRRVKA